MRIPCPHCGQRDHSEFHYGGDATIVRPAHDDDNLEHWYSYVFIRKNPMGAHQEYWHHVGGCREWIIVSRDTLTHEILDYKRAKSSTGGTRT